MYYALFKKISNNLINSSIIFFRNCKPNRIFSSQAIDSLDDLVLDGEKYIVGYIIYE